MKTLCIVPCGKRKIWDKHPDLGPQKACGVYIGPFSRKCQEYAKMFYPESWCILSAKYGFCWPDDVLPGPYDVTFNDKKTKPISIAELRKQADKRGLCEDHKFVVLGGKMYKTMMKEVFSAQELLFPLKGLRGIGFMLRRLNEAIKNRAAIA